MRKYQKFKPLLLGHWQEVQHSEHADNADIDRVSLRICILKAPKVILEPTPFCGKHW